MLKDGSNGGDWGFDGATRDRERQLDLEWDAKAARAAPTVGELRTTTDDSGVGRASTD